MKHLVRYLDQSVRVLNGILMAIAGFFLVAMVLLACANVVCRGFSMPVKGTFELMGFFGAVVAAFALAATQLQRQHIAVDVLVTSFPKGVRRILSALNYLIGTALFLLAAWQTGALANNLWKVHELSETLRIMHFPFVYAVSFGCVVIALVLIMEFMKIISGKGEEI